MYHGGHIGRLCPRIILIQWPTAWTTQTDHFIVYSVFLSLLSLLWHGIQMNHYKYITHSSTNMRDYLSLLAHSILAALNLPISCIIDSYRRPWASSQLLHQANPNVLSKSLSAELFDLSQRGQSYRLIYTHT